MNITTRPAFYSHGGKDYKPLEKFDPSEIKRLIELGRQRGSIGVAGQAMGLDKSLLDPAKLPTVQWGWIDVTPEIARKWLHNNFGNRPLREDTVRAYARDMLNKVWVPTHQGIAFNDKDVLIDGQHRLKAVVLSGVTVRFMVTFGLPSRIDGSEMTTMDAVDRGATRSVGDQLVIQHGFKHGSKTAQMASALASLCCGERTRRLSVGQTLEVYRAFEKSASYVIEHRSKETGVRAAGVMAGFAFALATDQAKPGPNGEKKDKYPGWDYETPITKLFLQLITGEKLKEGTAIHKLRQFLTSDESKLFTPTLNRGLAELTLQAIYLDLKGKGGGELSAALEGADYFRGLQPERIEKIAKIFKLPQPEAGHNAAPPAGPREAKPSKPKMTPEETNRALFDAAPAPVQKPAAKRFQLQRMGNRKKTSAGRKREARETAPRTAAPLDPPTAKELEWHRIRGEIPKRSDIYD